MPPNMAAINAQFGNAGFTQYQFHYDLVGPHILKIMHQLQKMLKLTSIEGICALLDPLAVTAELLIHGNLTPYERWICLIVRQDLLEMRDQHGNDPKLRSRVEKIEKRLHDLFYSIKSREEQSGNRKAQSPPAQQQEADNRPNSPPSSPPPHIAEPATHDLDDDSEEDFVMVDDPRTLVVEL
ncbi:hypothetical protein LTR24_004603 [Lithohypha guttulata]|uniref:Uncharacterized protein n=1 Tax=Lithohypha guttulata TaxID=1690604 RepID=A0ABR0KBX1_9EURO|nr:hypothetical protein LTR24_004603 [Lithohypha guttulata]